MQLGARHTDLEEDTIVVRITLQLVQMTNRCIEARRTRSGFTSDVTRVVADMNCCSVIDEPKDAIGWIIAVLASHCGWHGDLSLCWQVNTLVFCSSGRMRGPKFTYVFHVDVFTRRIHSTVVVVHLLVVFVVALTKALIIAITAAIAFEARS
jgi:hypothetical protein